MDRQTSESELDYVFTVWVERCHLFLW